MNRIECINGWEAQLTPGQLYVLVHTHWATDEHDEDVEVFGSLVYWTGTDLVYEDGEEARTDWDYIVAQSAPVNPEFIWN